jgi:phage tail-like protein
MVPGLVSPHPLGAALPALYQEDSFAQRLTGALDEVLAPIFASLDGLPAYLDPALAPDDFLEWLSGWVGVTLDETWPIERRRQLVADAAQLYRSRGTVAGLAAQVAIYTGGEVLVEDNGAAAGPGQRRRPELGQPGPPRGGRGNGQAGPRPAYDRGRRPERPGRPRSQG